MKVAFDIDNVLADIITAARETLARDAGVKASSILLTNVYHSPFSHPDPAVAERIAISHAFWDREDLLNACRPIPGSVEAAWRIHNAGVLAAYITRRPPNVSHITRRWLETNGYPPAPVHHVGSSDASKAFDTCKSSVCHSYGISHLVDDHATEVATARAAGIQVVVVDAEIGRDDRMRELARCPGVPLAADAADAADILIMHMRMAA